MRSFIILVALTVLIAGCGFEPGELDCKSGREGITARFVTGQFPTNIQQEVQTPILIEVENRGAYTSKQVYVWLRYGKDFFESNRDEIDITGFPGKAQWNRCTPQVQRDQITIEAFELPIATTSFQRPLTLDICYHYTNNVSTQVCVDPLPSSISALEPNCRPSERRISGGQGSPLGITKLDTPTFIKESGSDTSGKVRIGIHLENFGDGMILAYEEPDIPIEACTFQEQTYQNHVFIKAFLDNHRLDCNLLTGPVEIENKVFLRYDPEVVELDTGRMTIKNYFLLCETEDTIDLSREVVMTFDANIEYYYRDTRADERTTTIRKI